MSFRLFFTLFICWCFASNSYAVNPYTYIPPQAFTYKGVIKAETDLHYPDIPDVNYPPALIEHESCVSLTNKRCWSPTAELRTKRELGVGLLQITKAYRDDGTVRFDTLWSLKKKYRSELEELSWENVASEPTLQIRAMMLLLRDISNSFSKMSNSDINKLAFIDSAYNGGAGNLYKERRLCGLKYNCDPNIWFDNVERVCVRSTKKLYGRRSACDINRDHVRDVLRVRLPKYQKQYFINEETTSDTNKRP